MKGLKSGTKASSLSLKSKTVTLASSILGSDKTVSVSGGGYLYTLGGSGKLVNTGKAATLKGSSGKDTLIGGSGNDTLTGGKGADVFVYKRSSGKDVITDYTANTDKISITGGGSYSAKVSGNNVILTVGSGTLTIKNGKGKSLNINGSKKTYSKNVPEVWFDDDNNFVTADDISKITSEKSVGEFENYKPENIQENKITFAK